MSTLTTIAATDIISASRSVINANFATLNSEKVDINGSYADPSWLTSVAGYKVAGNIPGNAASATLALAATALATPRNIAGVPFDGTANIAIPYSGLTGAPSLAAIATSGSAADLSAGTVASARGGAGTVNGLLKANGSGVVSAAAAGTDYVVPAGNVATATALQNSRLIAGVSFNGTTDITIASTGLSDSADLVRGAAALSTPGQIPFIASAGSLSASSNLFWDAVNARLGIGATPSEQLSIYKSSTPRVQIESGGAGNVELIYKNTAGSWLTYVTASDFHWYRGVNRLSLYGATGNLAVGGGSDVGFRLSVTSSGAAGTVFVGDLTATVGTTSLIVRAGAGQSGNLTTWQNAAGTQVAAVTSGGNFLLGSSGYFETASGAIGINQGVINFGSTAVLAFGNTASYLSTKDFAIARNAGGVGEINNGTAGQFRDLRVRDLLQNGTSNKAVFGGEALTTAGWIPFTASSGVVSGSANLFWDNANARLGVGTNAPAVPLDVRASSAAGIGRIQNTLVSGFSAVDFYNNSGTLRGAIGFANGSAPALPGIFFVSSQPGVPLAFAFASTEIARFAATTGNLLINTSSDDGSNKLQVAGRIYATDKVIAGNFLQSENIQPLSAQVNFANTSNVNVGSYTNAGAWTFYNQTATTGSTSLVVRAGAGQSGNVFSIQSNAGVTNAGIASNGSLFLYSGTFDIGYNTANVIGNSQNIVYAWSNSSLSSGIKDSSISRQGLGVVQAGDGGANANGVFLASQFRAPLTTPTSASATGVQGSVVWDADFVYVATGTNQWKRAALTTW